MSGARLPTYPRSPIARFPTWPWQLPEAKAQATLSLTPNPAYGSVAVHLPAAPSPATLALLDALGRVVCTAAAPAGADYPLDLAGLASGIYTVRVRAGEALATQKLVVE